MTTNSKLNWAVIPCAGLGTRLLPVTRSIPKAMLPVGNYPLIHFAVTEATNLGIENILIIIGDGMDAIRTYFTENSNLNNALKLQGENNLLEDQNKITSLADIRFLLQEKPLGVGHAIKLTKRIIGDNPFAVILPDDLIFAKPNALGQLKIIYDKHGGNVIGLNKVKNNEIEKKGIVGYTEDKDRFKINQLIEKPKIFKIMNDEIRDTGMAIAGIRVALNDLKNTKITAITNAIAIASALKTSFIEASTNLDLS